MPDEISDPVKRHDFVLLFDVVDGNPNGDPDAGNLPRVDPETMHGLVTDVAIKRKVRDYVIMAKDDQAPYRIYINTKGSALNTLHQEAYTKNELRSTGSKQKREDVEKARSWMCKQFFDIRMFGAVMTTDVNAGQVRGPMQLTFARSIDPITPLDFSITRVAITDPKAVEVVEKDERGHGGKRTEMGRKPMVPYGLYRAHGFFNVHFATQTGVSRDDLELFWKALQDMWDVDRSASRGMMATRKIVVFTHESKLGNAAAHKLFERVRVNKKDEEKVARSFEDYTITVDDDKMPNGVSLSQLAPK